ncbi:hypothetical protein T4C_5507 [Trichinella pseudospiralis]|uniref:Uncharacterized protein n=1 Tax=Trichinella pseudospiralis TaxID=6337 RepID=A0A0V1K0I1_TRIPS|nr:hypothetical protein T4C_5507 [Trichinella pseudospiralis]
MNRSVDFIAENVQFFNFHLPYGVEFCCKKNRSNRFKLTTCGGLFLQSQLIIVYILTEFRMSSISNALETVFTATCAVSDFYANKGGFKNSFRNNSARSKRCAANEQWCFHCDGGRRIAIKTALSTRIEDGREGPEDDVSFFGTAIV